MTAYNLGTVVGDNGTDGRGIRCIQKTDTTDNVDTYTIYYTDDTTTTYEVTNGEGGADIDTSFPSTPSDTHVPSTKLVKNTFNGLSIPTKISDLTNDSDFIEPSSTSGLIKNDGSIDTSSYLTTGTASSTYIPKTDIVDNLNSSDNTKVLSAKQGKALYDLIAGIEEDMLQ